ncbi:hypothetical protein BOX07_gp02 [Pseudoalteromonas phage PH1]|uniref:hypothetical protein n=1 Tax=Pseudoalteromonas phage PH1 TaxID=1874540 RepID=UPI0008197E8D|nr:hypothetical protein BOX07_gp02 [Pseudoalteromonas phage PH1]ANY29513.1 hypothetical protein [Pseudoalteromonas phage PH1]
MLKILLKGLGVVATKMFATFASEVMLEWLLFKVAEALVKSTKTTKDDEWLNKFKEEYNK